MTTIEQAKKQLAFVEEGVSFMRKIVAELESREAAKAEPQ